LFRFHPGSRLPSVVAAVLLATVLGCVRRTMVITTEPPQALVFLNDQEVGRSEVSTDFLWYGDYDVIVRKEGYATLKANWSVKAPWYQVPPIDFFAEILWPGRIHDVRENHFVLTPQDLPSSEELLGRAEELEGRIEAPKP